MACLPYTGTVNRGIVKPTIYADSDGFGILVKYPVAEISAYSISEVFSLKVSDCAAFYVYLRLIFIQKGSIFFKNNYRFGLH